MNDYPSYAKRHAKKSPLLADTLSAYLFGGLICALGQALFMGYEQLLDTETARLLTAVTLIALSALLTGLDLFDSIAKHAGAGTLVPITGFANAVVSCAIDARDEGMTSGVGSKIFTVAGPVILYGLLAGVAYGILYLLTGWSGIGGA